MTLKDIAKMAGVSTATVSHVINETRYVTEETRKRVIDVIEEVGYRTNSIARSLRSKKTNTIGVIVPDIANSFFASIVEVIARDLKKKGYNLLLANSDEDVDLEKEQVIVMSNQVVDGLIIAPASKDHSYIKTIMGENYPIVFIDRLPVGCQRDCVMADNITGSFMAVNAFIQKGHKRIGIINGLEGLTTTDERLQGYKEALNEHGIPVDQSLIKFGNSKYESGYKLTEELCKNSNITALYVGNNSMTIGAVSCLINNNVKIPDSIAVIGFDDYCWANITKPALTVVRQPIDAISKKSVELLLKRINHGGTDYNSFRFATEIVYRESFRID